MKSGYSFHCFTGELHYFVSPKGSIVVMEVLGDIPYIRSGSDLCQPRKPLSRRTVLYPHAGYEPLDAAASPGGPLTFEAQGSGNRSGLASPAPTKEYIEKQIPEGCNIDDFPRVVLDPKGRD